MCFLKLSNQGRISQKIHFYISTFYISGKVISVTTKALCNLPLDDVVGEGGFEVDKFARDIKM